MIVYWKKDYPTNDKNYVDNLYNKGVVAGTIPGVNPKFIIALPNGNFTYIRIDRCHHRERITNLTQKQNSNMDEYDIKRLALVLSVQAEIDGMKVHNILSEEKYTNDAFIDKATELRDLAYKHNEQL